jgi:hypothetical protein
MTTRWCSALVGCLAWLAACGADELTPGHREPCAYPGGPLTGCEPAALETAEDACFRLVDCGVISIESNAFDWPACVARLDELAADRLALVARCVETASCDDLQPDDTGVSPCLALGSP